MKSFSDLENTLFGAMIGLAKACYVHEKQADTDKLLLDGLIFLGKRKEEEEFDCRENISQEKNLLIQNYIDKVREEKAKVAPDCASCFNPCGNTDDYDLNKIWRGDYEIREVKTKIIYALFNYARKMKEVKILEGNGKSQQEAIDLLYRGISVVSYDIPVERLQLTLEKLHQYSS